MGQSGGGSDFRVYTETKNNSEQEENDGDITVTKCQPPQKDSAAETLCRMVQDGPGLFSRNLRRRHWR